MKEPMPALLFVPLAVLCMPAYIIASIVVGEDIVDFIKRRKRQSSQGEKYAK